MDGWKSLDVSRSSEKSTVEVQDAFEGQAATHHLGDDACVMLRKRSAVLYFSPGAACVAELFDVVETLEPDGGDLVLIAGEEGAAERLFPGWPQFGTT